MRNISYFLVLLLLLTACGGGGGGGGGAATSSSSSSSAVWNSTISEAAAENYRTAEYKNQSGLEAIHAAEAYALLAQNGKTVAGNGILVGVVDSGTTTTHQDIAANLRSDLNKNFITSQSSSDVTDTTGHGTHVMSTITAPKNSSGIHGVAYNAKSFAVKVIGGSISEYGIEYAANNGADIINLSWSTGSYSSYNGDTYDFSVLLDEIKIAATKDVLMLAAAGNDADQRGDGQTLEQDPDYLTFPKPTLPALYANNSEIPGYLLAVGAVEEFGGSYRIADFSNNCGVTKEYCLVAPGVDIVGAAPTSLFPSGYATAEGTSMATPHVSGAAAVIRGAWPHLSATQTAQILLTTATDLGDVGVDDIYGKGLLNLYEAVQAQGQNTLAFGSNVAFGGYELASSSLVSSSIFGDAFTSNISPQLESAIFFDDYGRDYKANLSGKLSQRITDNFSNLTNLVSNNIESKNAPLNFGSKLQNHLNFSASTYKNPEAQNYFGLKFITLDRSIDQQAGLNRGFSFVHDSSDFVPNLKFGFSTNIDEVTNLNGDEFVNSGFVSQRNISTNPYQSFFQQFSADSKNNRQFNQFFAQQEFLAKKAALKFSYQSSYDSSQMLGKMGNKQNQLIDFGLNFKPKSGSNLLFSAGNLSEFNNNILNSRSVGAFESGGGVKTSYAKISISQKITKDLQFLSSFSEGISQINGNKFGIFREFNDVRSRSFSASLLFEDFFGGKVGIGYLEPMRIYRGNVKIDVPTARDLAGNLTRLQSTASLVPKGRERDLEIFYRKNLGTDSQISFNFVRQSEAGNIKSAATNYLGLAQFLMSY